MSESFTPQLERYLLQRRNEGLYRSRVLSDTNRAILDFSCNDYLSLTHDHRVKQAYRKGFELYPSGSGGSMVLCGYHSIHHQLEQAFAEALRVEDCLLYSSGYVANLSVVSMLAQFGAHLVIDKSVHASIYDGLKSANASFTRFAHNNINDLAKKLQPISTHAVIVTESIFSMSGGCAPLKD
ncbi:MAG TPA: aminotransferase class I/II-fold pyridoxal phosphate-dependent enzyme, partial [Legionellaceae bacterium]|nr:aminotransferase class I/II-fold pyridoxal phosphate-dependent enzyme [Legionellaceae bacterium]